MNDFNVLKQEILEIIAKYAFNKDLVRNAEDNAKIISDLKINSARIVDIILDIEEKYNIEIKDEDIEKMISVKNVVNIIQNS